MNCGRAIRQLERQHNEALQLTWTRAACAKRRLGFLPNVIKRPSVRRPQILAAPRFGKHDNEVGENGVVDFSALEISVFEINS